MPTYCYVCTACGRDLEAQQSFRDDPLTECPHCGGPLRKVFGAVGVVFKGSGFYRTDSRAAASGDGNGSREKSDTTASTPDSGGKDKPAAAAKESSSSSKSAAPADKKGSAA